MHFNINGQHHELEVDSRTSLLDLVREQLHLFGTKKGCNQGACGACTMLVDGQRINSCLALAVQYQGREITTIEGIGTPQALADIQAAFVEHDEPRRVCRRPLDVSHAAISMMSAAA